MFAQALVQRDEFGIATFYCFPLGDAQHRVRRDIFGIGTLYIFGIGTLYIFGIGTLYIFWIGTLTEGKTLNPKFIPSVNRIVARAGGVW